MAGGLTGSWRHCPDPQQALGTSAGPGMGWGSGRMCQQSAEKLRRELAKNREMLRSLRKD